MIRRTPRTSRAPRGPALARLAGAAQADDEDPHRLRRTRRRRDLRARLAWRRRRALVRGARKRRARPRRARHPRAGAQEPAARKRAAAAARALSQGPHSKRNASGPAQIVAFSCGVTHRPSSSQQAGMRQSRPVVVQGAGMIPQPHCSRPGTRHSPPRGPAAGRPEKGQPSTHSTPPLQGAPSGSQCPSASAGAASGAASPLASGALAEAVWQPASARPSSSTHARRPAPSPPRRLYQRSSHAPTVRSSPRPSTS